MRKALPLLAAAVLLAAASARAAGADARSPVKLSARGACECISKKVCWKLVREAFTRNGLGAKVEIEAALNDRFFPGAVAFALDKPDPEGHFLLVQCGGAPCGDKREALERRFIVTSFLVSLPLGVPRAELFDEQTWEVTAKGEEIFKQAKLCKSGLLPGLIAQVHAMGSH